MNDHATTIVQPSAYRGDDHPPSVPEPSVKVLFFLGMLPVLAYLANRSSKPKRVREVVRVHGSGLCCERKTVRGDYLPWTVAILVGVFIVLGSAVLARAIGQHNPYRSVPALSFP